MKVLQTNNLYHPPKPLYKPAALLDYIEAVVEELNRDFPAAHIVVAGDMNQLPDQDMLQRTGLTQIVNQPTRGTNVLDRIYVSSPHLSSTVRVVASDVKSDHKAVVAYLEIKCVQPKTKMQRTFRPETPTQNAPFLKHIADMTFENPQPSVSSDPSVNLQAEFDSFYNSATELLNQFYPIRS